jgi:phage tail protein
MSNVMLQLGPYQFSVNSAAYQEFQRTTEYRWAAQSRVGAHDALQFTGFGSDSIELSGVIYPFHRGGLGQLDRMRAAASIGFPLPLVSGRGRVLGLWVIESVSEGQQVFARDGVEKRQEFQLKVRRFDGGLRSLLPF